MPEQYKSSLHYACYTNIKRRHLLLPCFRKQVVVDLLSASFSSCTHDRSFLRSFSVNVSDAESACLSVKSGYLQHQIIKLAVSVLNKMLFY